MKKRNKIILIIIALLAIAWFLPVIPQRKVIVSCIPSSPDGWSACENIGIRFGAGRKIFSEKYLHYKRTPR